MSKTFTPHLILLVATALSAACFLLPTNSGLTFTTSTETRYINWSGILAYLLLFGGCTAACAQAIHTLVSRR